MGLLACSKAICVPQPCRDQALETEFRKPLSVCICARVMDVGVIWTGVRQALPVYLLVTTIMFSGELVSLYNTISTFDCSLNWTSPFSNALLVPLPKSLCQGLLWANKRGYYFNRSLAIYLFLAGFRFSFWWGFFFFIFYYTATQKARLYFCKCWLLTAAVAVIRVCKILLLLLRTRCSRKSWRTPECSSEP